MSKLLLAKVLTVKAVSIATASLAAGGVAVAAATGTLPDVMGNKPEVVASAAHDGKAKGQDGENRSNGSPSPSLHGLCQAFSSMPEENRAKVGENPAFGALVTAAGAQDKVVDFCDSVTKPGDGQSLGRGGPPASTPADSRPGHHPSPKPRR